MIKAAARLQPFSRLEFNRCVAAGSQSMNLDSGVELCNMKLLRALVNLSLTDVARRKHSSWDRHYRKRSLLPRNRGHFYCGMTPGCRPVGTTYCIAYT